MRWVRYWPATRSALIALVLALGLIDGCPLPNNKRTPEALQPTVKSLRKLRTQVMRPFKPIRDGFRLHETWKLFPTANINQHLMRIEGRPRNRGAWELLYQPNDAEHTFKADEIEYRRVRGAWNPGRSARRGYAPFTKWVAREVFAVRPDLNEVRVRLEKIKVRPKDGRIEPQGKFQFDRLVLREREREKPSVEQSPTEEDPDP